MLSESQNCGVCNILHTPTTCFRTTAPTLGNSSDAWNTALRRGRQRHLNTMIVFGALESKPIGNETQHAQRRSENGIDRICLRGRCGGGGGRGRGGGGGGSGVLGRVTGEVTGEFASIFSSLYKPGRAPGVGIGRARGAGAGRGRGGSSGRKWVHVTSLPAAEQHTLGAAAATLSTC